MKKSAAFLGATIALTLVFYLLAYFLLPGPPPTAPMMLLFAGTALAIVAGVQAIRNKKPAAKSKTLLLLLASLATLPSLVSCESAPRSTSLPSQSPPPPIPQSGSPNRVTGTALLLAGEKEQPGYGLYSYALLAHAPTAAEVPRVKAFFEALLQLPTAESVGQYVPHERINITYIPLTAPTPTLPLDAQNAKDAQDAKVAQVDWVIQHYDFARSAVILAGLGHTVLGHTVQAGPLLVSALTPMTSGQNLHPVLIQDLSRAQPALLTQYVAQFVSQVGADNFWQPDTLAAFTLQLRNGLEVAGTGLGMSKEAVSSWVKFFK